MIVYAVYIILPEGTPIFSRTFRTSEGINDSILLSGLLTALQTFASEITQSPMKTVESEGMSFHFMRGYNTHPN